jgi:hypothetical protein
MRLFAVRSCALCAQRASVDLLPDLIGRARHKAWLMLIAKQRANNRAFVVVADRRVRRSLKKPGAGA